MKKHLVNFFAIALSITMLSQPVLAVTPTLEASNNSLSFVNNQEKSLIQKVTSSPTPWSGQRSRSSVNFSLPYYNIDYYTFQVYDVVEVNGVKQLVENNDIVFDIYKDRSLFPDEVSTTNVKNGSTRTLSEIKFIDTIYIANPHNATTEFEIHIYGNRW